jgi:hypothetical protein
VSCPLQPLKTRQSLAFWKVLSTLLAFDVELVICNSNGSVEDFSPSTNIIYSDKSKRLILARHVACVGEKRNAYRVLVGKRERKITLE